MRMRSARRRGERGQHQVQVDRQAVHHHDLAGTRTDQRRCRFTDGAVGVEPALRRVEPAVDDAQPRPSVQLRLHHRPSGDWLRAEGLPGQVRPWVFRRERSAGGTGRGNGPADRPHRGVGRVPRQGRSPPWSPRRVGRDRGRGSGPVCRATLRHGAHLETRPRRGCSRRCRHAVRSGRRRRQARHGDRGQAVGQVA